MKGNNRQKKNGYQKPKRSKPSKRALRSNLVTALAPLHSMVHAQLRMYVTLTLTTASAVQQVVTVFAEAAQEASPLETKNLQDQAEEDLQKAMEDLDKSDPFDPIFGGKAGFGEGADFPGVCYEKWREQVGNIIKARAKIEERLKEEGDPEAFQHANDAIRNRSIAASEAFARCLHSPIRKLPVPTP